MSEIRITNCHIHSFTTAHVPRRFPHALLLPFKRFPVAVRAAWWGRRKTTKASPL